MAGLKYSEELESILAPYRAEYSQIVRDWIESGAFGATYSAYLVESFHQMKHSCSLLSYACARQDHNHLELQESLARHEAEETGHDAWLLDDLEHLGVDRRQALASPPLHETINLIGSQLYVITYLHPTGLLGYLYALESRPPTKEYLTLLRKAFDIPPKAMTFLIRHGQEDVEHKRELECMLDNHVVNPQGREAVIISATTGLSNVNRLLARVRSGEYANCLPQVQAAFPVNAEQGQS